MYVQSNKDQVAELASYVLKPDFNITCLEGGSGSGKSALIANFQKQFSEKHPDNIIVAHYIGCSSESTDLGMMLRRLIIITTSLFLVVVKSNCCALDTKNRRWNRCLTETKSPITIISPPALLPLPPVFVY